MSSQKCPGQDSRNMRAEEITEATCGNCGNTVEMWPDEPAQRCRECGERVINPEMDLKCLEWCEYAEDCLRNIRSGKVDPEELRNAKGRHHHGEGAEQ